MTFFHIPYVRVLIIAGLITTALGIYAWRRRPVRGALPFAVSMAVVTIWSWANALEMSGADLPTKLFWANVQYFAYAFSSVTLVIMVSFFTNNEKWINRRNILLLCIIPLITNLLVWSNEFHGLIRQNVHLDQGGTFPVIAKNYGPWFWAHIVYSYSLNITAIFLLIKTLRHKSPLYRGQSLTILTGTVLIVVPNILYILGLSPVARFDVTPVFMAVSGCIIAWGLFRYRLFDVAPVARAKVIDSMGGAVIVLDEKMRVSDLNPAAGKLLGLPTAQALGRQAEKVFRLFPEVLQWLQKKRETLSGFLEIEKEGRHYQVNFSSLFSERGLLIGQLLVIYNITEVKEIQQKLMDQQRNLAVLTERERLGRELHDSLGQVLGYINIQAQAMRQELGNGRLDLGECCKTPLTHT